MDGCYWINLPVSYKQIISNVKLGYTNTIYLNVLY